MFDPSEIVDAELTGKVPGFCIAVAIDGKTVWSRESGLADLEAKTPVTAATRFRIGSVSKPLTSVGLALLVERGLMDLDAPIQKYLPDYPDKGAIITPRLLAGHLSGIRNYQGTEAATNPPVRNLREGLKVFENDPLLSPPGEKFAYASYNWNVLGAAMEAAAQQEFLAFMEENVLRPLGLDATGPDYAGASDPALATFYESAPDGRFVPAPPSDSSSKWPAGGYLSTVDDMLRFGHAVLQPGFLRAESLRQLFTSQKTTAGVATNYGLGWAVFRAVVYHAGDSKGGSAILLLHPVRKTVVAMATNGGQVMLRAGLRLGRIPGKAKCHVIYKERMAMKIAAGFARAGG